MEREKERDVLHLDLFDCSFVVFMALLCYCLFVVVCPLHVLCLCSSRVLLILFVRFSC